MKVGPPTGHFDGVRRRPLPDRAMWDSRPTWFNGDVRAWFQFRG